MNNFDLSLRQLHDQYRFLKISKGISPGNYIPNLVKTGHVVIETTHIAHRKTTDVNP